LKENEDSYFSNLIQGYDDVELHKKTYGGLHFELIEDVGGEGQGDHCHLVYLVTKDEDSVYFKIDGWHNSFDGCNYDSSSDLEIVEPYMKEVRDWRQVKG
jgi:hypothetical protein